MRIVQVSRPGLRFILALVLTLFVRRNDYDCIYSRDPLLMAVALPLKILGKTMVLELNGIPSLQIQVRRQTRRSRVPKFTPLICNVLRLIELVAIRYSDLVLPITEKMRRFVLRCYGPDVRKVVVVRNGVDTRVFRPLETERKEMRRKLGIEKETAVLYSSGFSARWRDTKQLFRIAEHVLRKRMDVVFLVLGDGPLLEEAKSAYARIRATDRTIFLGSVDYQSVPRYINAADVYVYDVTPEAYRLVEKEGPCPMKVLESMACGKPVIVPRESQLEELLQISQGGFSASSVDEVEVLIERFAGARELAKLMGANARRYIERSHDLTLLAKQTMGLIDEVISFKKE